MNNLIEHEKTITKKNKNDIFGHKSPVIWFIGLSGSGKSTIANGLENRLFELGLKTHILDGDNVRLGLNSDLGFSIEDRGENIRRIAEVSKLLSDSGTITMTAFISPIESDRVNARKIIGDENMLTVFVDTPLSLCEIRDTKGLYKKARNGEIKNFTGIDSPFEEPFSPDVTVETHNQSVDDCVNQILRHLYDRGMINIKTESNWMVQNYGGNPMGEGKAVFVGRWQPYHNGHISLMKNKLDKGIPVLILVRDMPPDERNPFTTEQTVSMIEKYHKSKNEDVEVMVIPDIESLNFGRGVGYEVNQFFPPENISMISATKIRNSINDGNNDWREIVDVSIQDDVIKYLM